MTKIKGIIASLLGIFFFAGVLYIGVNFYSPIFSKKIIGKIENVERVELNLALLQSQGKNDIPSDLFSFAVAIKIDGGEIFTSSATDRQWAVAQPGQCVEALLYPYPPWNLDKAGTFFNARILKLSDCSVPSQ